MRTARSSSRPGGLHQPLRDQAPPPGPGTHRDQAPPTRGQTHTRKHITLPQTSFAGGNNIWL